MMLILLLLVLAVFYVLLKKRQEETPLDVLKRRDAKGEITKEQFEEMKKDL